MLRASTYGPHWRGLLSQGYWSGQDLGAPGPPESCTHPSFTFHSHPFTEELQKLLLEQMELRKKLEREFQSLKGTPIPDPPHRPHSHSSPELPSCRLGLVPGPQCRQLRALRNPPNPPFLGFPARPKTEEVGVGMESGEIGPREGAVRNSSHLINLHR